MNLLSKYLYVIILYATAGHLMGAQGPMLSARDGGQSRTPEAQKRQAWKTISNSGEMLPPKDAWWYHKGLGLYNKELHTAANVYLQAGRPVPALRTTYENLDPEDQLALSTSKGNPSAMMDKDNIYLSPFILRRLGKDAHHFEKTDAVRTLLHEETHKELRHTDKVIAMLDDLSSMPENMRQAWYFNARRRFEYEADKGALEKMPLAHLWALRGALYSTDHEHDALHPSHAEDIMMVNEELQARRKGKRLSEAELPSAQSFFSRNVPVSAD